MRRGLTFLEFMKVFCFMSILTAVVVSKVLPHKKDEKPIVYFDVNKQINSLVSSISDMDKRNSEHSLKQYADNKDALTTIENKWNLLNKDKDYSIHLSKIDDRTNGIHVSIIGKFVEDPWSFIDAYGNKITNGVPLSLSEHFYKKNVRLTNVENKSYKAKAKDGFIGTVNEFDTNLIENTQSS